MKRLTSKQHHASLFVCGQREWEGCYGLRLDGEEAAAALRSCLMHLVEHQLSGDARLRPVLLTGPPLKRSHVLLDHLVEEHGGQLGVQQGAELKGYLGRIVKKQTNE